MKKIILFLFLCFILSCSKEKNTSLQTGIVTDSFGRNVSIPKNVTRIITIDRGFTPQVLKAIGKDKLIAGTGGLHPNSGPYNSDRTDTFFLITNILNLPKVGWAGYGGYDFEKILEINPEVIIIVAYSSFKENSYHKELVDKIENEFKIPVVMLEDYGSVGGIESITSYYNNIKIIGEIVNAQKEADDLISKLQKQFDIAKSFVKSNDNRMLFLGMTDKDTGGGYVYGEDFGAAALTTSFLEIKNVFTNKSSPILSSEAILEFNPDIIMMIDAPLSSKSIEMYKTNPIFKNINAVKNNRIYNIGQLDWWSDSKLMFPLKIILYSAIYYEYKEKSLKTLYKDYMTEMFGLTSEESEKLLKIHKLEQLMDN